MTTRPRHDVKLSAYSTQFVMTQSITTYDMLLRLVKQEKEAYQKLLGCPGSAEHVDDKTLLFELFLDNKYTEFVMKLSYTPMDAPTGYTFHRLKCTMTLDGKPISLRKLQLIADEEFIKTRTERLHG